MPPMLKTLVLLEQAKIDLTAKAEKEISAVLVAASAGERGEDVKQLTRSFLECWLAGFQAGREFE